MSENLYEYEYTDMTIKWRRHGQAYLTIGVGGPIAAREIAHLLDELNAYKTELEALRAVAEAAKKAMDVYSEPSDYDADEMAAMGELADALEAWKAARK